MLLYPIFPIYATLRVMSQTMTPRERVFSSLERRRPDRAPRDLWFLPGVPLHRAEELERLRALWPSDFASPDFRLAPGLKARGEPSRRGRYTDDWGCEWDVYEDGVVGEIKHPPLADWAALARLRPPEEILRTDWGSASRRGGTDRFLLAGTTVRPFERMQFLRGSENLLLDMGWADARFLALRDLVHAFHMEELSHWARTDVDGLSFMDDWGTQTALLVSPQMWREWFKPLYRQYVGLIHAAGKKAFFHSDGMIRAIIPDLVEIGVDALNCQLFCMDIEEIGRQLKGRIAFWGEIDRQRLLPFGTPEEVRAAVRRVRRALDDGTGGVIAQCEWGLRDPFENVAAVYEAWME